MVERALGFRVVKTQEPAAFCSGYQVQWRKEKATDEGLVMVTERVTEGSQREYTMSRLLCEAG